MATILIIDDEESLLEVLTQLLEGEGYETLSFLDAAPALETVDFETIDLIIMDLWMPTSGAVATQEIRTHGFKTPIII